jgi:preprotein translocase subunit SecD
MNSRALPFRSPLAAAATTSIMAATVLLALPGCKPPPDFGWKCVLEAEPLPPDTALTEAARGRLVHGLTQRLREAGNYRPHIVSVGSNRFEVIIPGLRDEHVAAVTNRLTRSGLLEFRLVHEKSAELIRLGTTSPDCEVLEQRFKDADGKVHAQALLVERNPALTSQSIQRVGIDRSPDNRIVVCFEMNPAGAEAFARVTRENVGRLLAIVVDGEVQSAPVIKTEIPNGRCQIDGGANGFSPQEAVELGSLLENPLPVRLKIVEAQGY